LILAYYMPPAGGPAVQRILQFVEYLSAYGWQPEVLTVKEGAYPNRDTSLEDLISDDVPVHRTHAFDPLAVYRRLRGGEGLPAGALHDEPTLVERAARWIRANIFIPDARVGWWPFAHTQGLDLLKSGRFDAILSSGAPHSVHLAGRSLAQSTGIPWIADLHDPWTDISYYDDFPHTWWARSLDRRLERSVLEDATMTTTVSPSWAELFRSKVDGRYGVVENGFDTEELEAARSARPSMASVSLDVEAPEIEAPERTPDAEQDADSWDGDHRSSDAVAPGRSRERGEASVFTISHIGKVYASRNPTAFWDALAALRDEDAIPRLRVRLIGTVDPSVLAAVDERGLTPFVERIPFVPHVQALQAMVGSSLLLLVIEPFQQARGMITSKLYEYLASGRPVLGVGPTDGDAAALLARHDAGRMVDWSDARSAKKEVKAHYTEWMEGRVRVGADWGDVQIHSREVQAERMAGYLEEAVEQS